VCHSQGSFVAARLAGVKPASKARGGRLDGVLQARLLGALEVTLDRKVIDSPASQRPWAVFAYLALADGPVSRSDLASRFWPDVLDRSARASLRSALWALRRDLGDRVVVEGDRIGLSLDDAWVDMREFERLSAVDPPGALELCRGELLEGLQDDWAVSARTRHREQVIALLETLAAHAQRRGDAAGAVLLTRRQVERDPFDEASHRRLMTRLDAAGDRAGAIRAYRALAERLRGELGVAPAAATREAADALRAPASDPPRGLVAGGMSAAGPLALVGRDREAGELQSVWSAAAGGTGAAAVLRGEAGIGKTRLAGELRALARGSGARTATGAALDLGGTAPFSLWAELIRELLPQLSAPPVEAGWPGDLALLAAELPAHFERGLAPSASIAPDLQRTRLFGAVVALLTWAAHDAPLLLVLEDVHSADAPSLELAAYAARRIGGLALMLLITRRAQPARPDADSLEQALRARGVLALELDLSPLPPESVAALARQAAELTPEQVERVIDRAEGNALLAVETAKALRGGSDEVAPSLRGAMRAALAPLPADVRELVDLAAVAGRPLSSLEIRGLAGAGDPERAASAAVESGVLGSAAGGVGFRHALLRDAVYEELSAPRRSTLHREWAAALEAAERNGAVPRPAEIARHLRLGGAARDAVPALVRAAAEARALAALEQAAGYLREALELDGGRADLWLELGELEAWRVRRQPAEEAFDQAVALLEGGDPLELARAWLRRARAYHGPICVPRAVLDSAGKALELLASCEPSEELAAERSEALAARAWAEAVAGDVGEAERLLAELSVMDRSADELRTYDVAHARALALMRRGRFVESYGPSIAAGEAIGRAGRPDLAYGCWANAASAAVAAGEHERGLEFLERGMDALSGHGLQSLEIHLLGAESFVLRSAGRPTEARAAAASELALAEQTGQPELVAMASHDLGLVALDLRDWAVAAELLQASLIEGAPISRPLTRLALAESLARGGEPRRAAEQVRATVLEPVRPSDFPDTLVPRLARIQGLIALAIGDDAEAARRLAEAVTGWERVVARSVRADTITVVLADLGRPVVGLVEPERELATARADLQSIAHQGRSNAVVP
jgi:DNA-binding SARP family transcriptional activator